ncbi:MAG: hypothetical protein JO184_17180, partial [Gammaproteobacteria bacterium]|nr:hypothetical protein [Gammaproteobacteria bacterium]
MSLRLKLLLLGLATLVLPWAGCNYAREMEGALRTGEQASLQAVAQTIAASLQGRTDLLYRAEQPPAAADSGAGYDIRPLTLAAAPLLDGYRADWPRDPGAWLQVSRDAHHHFGLLTGVHEHILYLVLEVHDEHPLFDAPGTNTLDPATFGDRVWLGFADPAGDEHQLFLAATAPGAVTAR